MLLVDLVRDDAGTGLWTQDEEAIVGRLHIHIAVGARGQHLPFFDARAFDGRALAGRGCAGYENDLARLGGMGKLRGACERGGNE